ncbi:hypothetical protein SAMN06265348_10819 [Pedobacter westerhofensis]|uniref:Uncharacterized protein n=1 Tax=Pedobacter westerhofensis TaxID=425512 RepID=A0A521EG20_9SPHI|nr:hypothetical protein [Pedobacter westerhofensis]SMO82411.1 hypothetical protein SAMN06265348_10819 [Pedobacter westerhofensis]
MTELEEKVNMLEELFQGFVTRVKVLESDVPEYLVAFLNHYNNSLTGIYEQIDLSNRRYDHSKIQQNIDDMTKVQASMPTVIEVKNRHYFGAWSRSLIIAIVVSFFLVASSVGTALHLSNKNNELKSEARNFWFVRALYPITAKTVVSKLEEDPKTFTELAEKEIEKQNAIIAAKAIAERAEAEQKAAKENLEKAKSGK